MTELLVILAVAYITYLIVEAEFPPIRRVRSWLMDHSDDTAMYLLTCWWCTGFWVSFTVVMVTQLLDVSLSVPALLIPAAALVAGLTGELFGLVFWVKTNLQRNFEEKLRGTN